MKIETTIKYYDGYIPQKFRKMRYKEVFKSVWVNIKKLHLIVLNSLL